jgi:hypothetical protein
MAKVDKKSSEIKRKPPKGGARPGSGRPAGARNKVTLELQEAAKVYTGEALETLRKICIKGESEAARVSAACALLDRAHGKPKQQLDLAGDQNNPVRHVHEVRWMTEEEAKGREWA